MKLASALALFIGGLAVIVVAVVNRPIASGGEPVGDVAAFEAGMTTTTAPEQWQDTEGGAAGDAAQPTTSESPLDAERAAIRFTVAEQEPASTRTPVRLTIPALGRSADINPAGVAANGDMEVPDNVTDVAWYRYGAAPGEQGSAVLAAHVDLAGQGPGVFFELQDLVPGDRILIEFDDGSTETFVTSARTIYDKSELPTEAIFRRDGPPVVSLVTCGGGFNRQLRSYDSNVVVYAVPLDRRDLAPGEVD